MFLLSLVVSLKVLNLQVDGITDASDILEVESK